MTKFSYITLIIAPVFFIILILSIDAMVGAAGHSAGINGWTYLFLLCYFLVYAFFIIARIKNMYNVFSLLSLLIMTILIATAALMFLLIFGYNYDSTLFTNTVLLINLTLFITSLIAISDCWKSIISFKSPPTNSYRSSH
jgi:hypothetical protein